MKIICLLLLSIFILSPSVFAQTGWQKISGEMTVAHAPISDSDPKNPLVAYIVVRDKTAKQIFDAMKTIKAKTSECGDPKVLWKSAGNLVCSKEGSNYVCDIGINLKNGKSEFGRPC